MTIWTPELMITIFKKDGYRNFNSILIPDTGMSAVHLNLADPFFTDGDYAVVAAGKVIKEFTLPLLKVLPEGRVDIGLINGVPIRYDDGKLTQEAAVGDREVILPETEESSFRSGAVFELRDAENRRQIVFCENYDKSSRKLTFNPPLTIKANSYMFMNFSPIDTSSEMIRKMAAVLAGNMRILDTNTVQFLDSLGNVVLTAKTDSVGNRIIS